MRGDSSSHFSVPITSSGSDMGKNEQSGGGGEQM